MWDHGTLLDAAAAEDKAFLDARMDRLYYAMCRCNGHLIERPVSQLVLVQELNAALDALTDADTAALPARPGYSGSGASCARSVIFGRRGSTLLQLKISPRVRPLTSLAHGMDAEQLSTAWGRRASLASGGIARLRADRFRKRSISGARAICSICSQ